MAGRLTSAADFYRWWTERHRDGRFEVTRIPFADLDSWEFDPATGNLGHVSGRFFTVEGVEARTGGVATQSRPIIHQPEIGLLGLLVKDVAGVRYCLMQAKMEPGNVNTLQLSPTVQATRSNYTRVHRGGDIRYLDYFTGPNRGEVMVDVLQSEQGAWFWRKRNRNIVVRVSGEVPAHEDFRWLPLRLVRELIRVDNLVNMDTRTVLACLPVTAPASPGPAAGSPFAQALARSYLGDRAGAARHSEQEILSWFTEAKARCDWHVRLVPLSQVTTWSRGEMEIADERGRGFQIVAVRVRARNREVASWSQPLLAPRGHGLAIMVVRVIDGVLHLLVQACPELGLLDLMEMGPTIHVRPDEDGPPVGNPTLTEVVTGRTGRIRFDALLSEEGGRFHHALTRYRIVEVGEEFPVEVAPRYCWLTLHQLMALLRHGHYLNIEARSLLACLQSLW